MAVLSSPKAATMTRPAGIVSLTAVLSSPKAATMTRPAGIVSLMAVTILLKAVTMSLLAVMRMRSSETWVYRSGNAIDKPWQ